jgi:hypothetical protein
MTTRKEPDSIQDLKLPLPRGWQAACVAFGAVLLTAAFFVSGLWSIGFFIYGAIFILGIAAFPLLKKMDQGFEWVDRKLGSGYETARGFPDSRSPSHPDLIRPAKTAQLQAGQGPHGSGCRCGISRGQIARGPARKQLPR